MSGELGRPVRVRADLEAELRTMAAVAGGTEERVRWLRRDGASWNDARVVDQQQLFSKALGKATRVVRSIMDLDGGERCSLCNPTGGAP